MNEVTPLRLCGQARCDIVEISVNMRNTTLGVASASGAGDEEGATSASLLTLPAFSGREDAAVDGDAAALGRWHISSGNSEKNRKRTVRVWTASRRRPRARARRSSPLRGFTALVLSTDCHTCYKNGSRTRPPPLKRSGARYAPSTVLR